MNNREFGNMGEDLACEYLIKNGFKIIERNKHYSRFCELDIIAKEKNTLVFIEVKTRHTNDFGTPMDAITKTKYANIKTGALNYLSEHPTENYRIDIVGITIKPEFKIEHLKNV